MFDVENFQSFIEALDGGHYWTMIPNKWSLNLHLDKKHFDILKASIFSEIEKVHFDSIQL